MILLPMYYVCLRLSPLFIIFIATRKKIGYFDSISDIINETPFVALRAKNIAKYSRYSFNFDFFSSSFCYNNSESYWVEILFGKWERESGWLVEGLWNCARDLRYKMCSLLLVCKIYYMQYNKFLIFMDISLPSYVRFLSECVYVQCSVSSVCSLLILLWVCFIMRKLFIELFMMLFFLVVVTLKIIISFFLKSSILILCSVIHSCSAFIYFMSSIWFTRRRLYEFY